MMYNREHNEGFPAQSTSSGKKKKCVCVFFLKPLYFQSHSTQTIKSKYEMIDHMMGVEM